MLSVISVSELFFSGETIAGQKLPVLPHVSDCEVASTSSRPSPSADYSVSSKNISNGPKDYNVDEQSNVGRNTQDQHGTKEGLTDGKTNL